MPRERDFGLVTVPIPEPDEGQVLVRNIYMSVDPYMRGRISDRKRYTPPFQLGEPLTGGCVGQVVVSKSSLFQVGDYVLGQQGWREYYISSGTHLTKIDPHIAPIQTYLGTVGMPGMTAYIGILDIGRPKAGETVFVSAASGAVGAIACQIAKIVGCRVVGSAGSREKVAWLLDIAGVDAAFNYKEAEDLISELGAHCPNGIDVYFDNVFAGMLMSEQSGGKGIVLRVKECAAQKNGIFFTLPDDLVTISDTKRPEGKKLMLYRKVPRSPTPSDMLYTDFKASDLIRTLGGLPDRSAKGDVQALSLTYSQVLQVVRGLCLSETGGIKARFELQPPGESGRIRTGDGMGIRPDTPEG